MPLLPAPADEGRLEECVDRIDELVNELAHHPEIVLALALRIHLGALLRAMVESHACTREEARQFVLELEHEALGVGDD